VKNALSVLDSVGIDTELLCHRGSEEYDSILPACFDETLVNGRILRELEEETKTSWFYVRNCFMVFLCVMGAALAAGLTMGLLSLEVLDLKIKEMASSSEEEKAHAKILIPFLKDHHRLLVTLLLLNSIANEALPIYLDTLVPSYMAVMLSVTLVLFFGEIIPTAIFAGPKKLAIASSLSWIVRLLLFVLAPLAIPIARLLDFFLHENEDDNDASTKYNRGEIAALVKIQYEDRMIAKAERRRRKLENSISQAARNLGTKSITKGSNVLGQSVHFDEVTMVEGALGMRIKTAQDVMTSLNEVYAVPDDLILDELNMVDIYRRGYSRVPVYKKNKDDFGEGTLEEKSAILGVLLTRNLIVVDARHDRPLSHIPYQKPYCVHPDTHMVDLMNLFQKGGSRVKGGHLAVVCMNPEIANESLANNEPISLESGVIGIVSMEDCVEELIQEEIYDEFDKPEKVAMQRAQSAADKWKSFVRQKKFIRSSRESENKSHVIDADDHDLAVCETSLLVNKVDATLV